MQQWQSQESYRPPPRQRSHGQRSSGWRIFWSTWWMVGALPWLFVFWWGNLLPLVFLILVYVIVLSGYFIVPALLRRRGERPSVRWRIFWSTWWMVGALPWLFVFWWQVLLPIAFVVLVEVIVLFVYVVGLSKESRRSHRTPEPSVNPSPPPPLYEQGYQGQSWDTPASHMTSSWDEQPQASYPELGPPDV